MDQLGETIDALVIGAYWGQGNRGGRHASFMVGLRDDSKPLTANGQPQLVRIIHRTYYIWLILALYSTVSFLSPKSVVDSTCKLSIGSGKILSLRKSMNVF